MGMIKTKAASKAGMDDKTARKYIDNNKMPSECKKEHDWRTRKDPFKDEWEEIKNMLGTNEGLEGKTLFEYLQKKDPGKFEDGQIRTLQRKIKIWRATEGRGKEIYFPQKHEPGELGASDFTRMKKIGITIGGEKFDHMIYHFVLTYSNWEAGTICFSESYESLSTGLQNALWELGGVPKAHRTDRLTAAVNKECNPEEFTKRYKALMAHYRLSGKKGNAGKGNENGDVEQSHHRFKRAVEQSLLLRGSRDFKNRKEYQEFIKNLFIQLNSGRLRRLQEEIKVLKELPDKKLEDREEKKVRVGPSSTINIKHNTYSVHSRLKGEWVKVYIYADHLAVWYGQQKREEIPRLRGEKKHCIQYRHIIDQLIRKPGAFDNYRYKEDLYPSSFFRMAYDSLQEKHSSIKADKEYLKILNLAAKENESDVERGIKELLSQEEEISFSGIEKKISNRANPIAFRDVTINEPDLNIYDDLLDEKKEELTYA